MTYAKFLLAAVVTVISGVGAAMTDGRITDLEWVNVAIAGVGALAVYTAPNVPFARVTKAILAVLTAVLTLLTSAITDGISPAEWLQIVIVVIGALGVYAVPNRSAAPVAAAGPSDVSRLRRDDGSAL